MPPHGAAERSRANLVAVTSLGGSIQSSETNEEARVAAASGTARLLDADATVWWVTHRGPREVHAVTADSTGSTALDICAAPSDKVRDVMRTSVPILDTSSVGASCIYAPFSIGTHTSGLLEVRAGADRVPLDPTDLAVAIAFAERLGSELRGRHLREEYKYRALHDPLTGLPNRRSLAKHLEGALSSAPRQSFAPHVIFLDVDRFKLVNDSLGHAVGDRLIREVSKWIRQQLREGDFVARFGGDEFVVVLNEDLTPEDLAHLLDRLTEPTVERKIATGSTVFVTLSAGVAHHQPDLTGDTMLKQADAAMFEAKGSSVSRWCEYTDAMGALASSRLRDQSDLRLAFARGEIFCEYQPILDLALQAVVAHEALVRWLRPSIGRVEPSSFIATAEGGDLIRPMTELVLADASAQATRWPLSVSVSVNISARSVADPKLVSLVLATLQRLDLAPQRLILEITETALMANRPKAMEHLDELHRNGVRIAVDDFGTGYTSIEDLDRIPLDILKIDRRFVRNSVTSRGHAMLEALKSMADALGVSTIAEGVETPQMFANVRELGFTMAQGFLLGRPTTADLVRHDVAASRLEVQARA